MLLVQNLPLVLLGSVVVVKAADLVIRIPGDLSQQDGFYRLDYRCSGWRGGRAGGVKGFCVLRRQLRSCATLLLLFLLHCNAYPTLSGAFNAYCTAYSYFSMEHKACPACMPFQRIFG